MKLRNAIVIAGSLFCLTQAGGVMAQSTIVTKIGTLGGGLEYVHSLSPKIAVGVGINGLDYNLETDEADETDYEADFNMQSLSLLGDYHPMGNGFRISAGIMQNGNEFDIAGTPTGNDTVELNGITYTSSDVGSVKAAIAYDGIAPYLGVGWGRAPQSGRGWGFDADLGVLVSTDPDISLDVTCGPSIDGTAACTALQASAALEEASLQNDSTDFDMFPVISLGVSYSF